MSPYFFLFSNDIGSIIYMYVKRPNELTIIHVPYSLTK